MQIINMKTIQYSRDGNRIASKTFCDICYAG